MNFLQAGSLIIRGRALGYSGGPAQGRRHLGLVGTSDLRSLPDPGPRPHFPSLSRDDVRTSGDGREVREDSAHPQPSQRGP